MREARVVVGAAIVAGGRLLVQERGFPAEVAGKWELPGGRVEPGESDVDALRRECREELGVRVEVGEPVGVDVPLRRDLVLRVYSASVVEGEVAALEHRGVRWVGSVELAQVDWLPADRVLVPALGELLG
ncbi:(deoxy)nucleoside triphosphate pyrophosphohydrolase [Actinokineospora auranticolor]|nr:(deoxy)nucleoside triphosphate pyrophosphohydrolase [Actinokineospora auranticolor]